MPKKLSTFWYYLWRQRISERQKCFLTIFDFRRSDFWGSDQADDYCHFRRSDQLLFLSLSAFWSTLKILSTFWSINQLLYFGCSFFDFRQSDFQHSDPFPKILLTNYMHKCLFQLQNWQSYTYFVCHEIHKPINAISLTFLRWADNLLLKMMTLHFLLHPKQQLCDKKYWRELSSANILTLQARIFKFR